MNNNQFEEGHDLDTPYQTEYPAKPDNEKFAQNCFLILIILGVLASFIH